MKRLLSLALLTSGASLLTGFGTFVPPAPARDALDPVRLAQASCGDRRSQAVLQSRLLLASKFAREPGKSVRLLPIAPDLSASRLPITTSNARARLYFNQGLTLTYGFNHAGAVASFREASNGVRLSIQRPVESGFPV